jgi:hypothetical protein
VSCDHDCRQQAAITPPIPAALEDGVAFNYASQAALRHSGKNTFGGFFPAMS